MHFEFIHTDLNKYVLCVRIAKKENLLWSHLAWVRGESSISSSSPGFILGDNNSSKVLSPTTGFVMEPFAASA